MELEKSWKYQRGGWISGYFRVIFELFLSYFWVIFELFSSFFRVFFELFSSYFRVIFKLTLPSFLVTSWWPSVWRLSDFFSLAISFFIYLTFSTPLVQSVSKEVGMWDLSCSTAQYSILIIFLDFARHAKLSPNGA